MRELRERNMEKMNQPESEAKYCVCRKEGTGFMLQCELCRDWFHGRYSQFSRTYFWCLSNLVNCLKFQVLMNKRYFTELHSAWIMCNRYSGTSDNESVRCSCHLIGEILLNMITSVRILWKLSQAPANVNFPWNPRAQSFKPIWNVRAAFIGWKVSAKKACVKIHIVWLAIKIYN